MEHSSEPHNLVTPIGLLGLGVVGSAVVKAIETRETLGDSLVSLDVVASVVRDVSVKRDVPVDSSKISADPDSVIANPAIRIVVEVMGGETPAFEFIRRALQAGKHVVTANKAVMSKRGSELLTTARTHGVHLLYEASVAGGIPIIGPLMNDLSANKIMSIRGIINGTTNFILTKMAHEGADFDDVLSEAQMLGYAEADPTADIDGFDAMYKLSVLARLAYHTEVPVESIYREGIRQIHAKDFRYARELGYTIKLLGVVQANQNLGLLPRVHPALVPLGEPMASVNGVLNAVEVEGDLVDSLWFQGPGAGPNPTASEIIGDINKIATEAVGKQIIGKELEPFVIASLEGHKCQYYIRITADDRPGVLANVARVLGDADISIKSVLQKDTDVDNNRADLVIMTHPAQESNMQSAVGSIRALDTVACFDSLIRVETYNS